jgi:hypothetical protein
LDQTPDQFSPSTIDVNDFWGQQFTTGISANLVSIRTSLGEFDGGLNQGFSVTAQLFVVDSANSTPDMGTLLGTLKQVGSIPSGAGNFANVEFDPAGSISLDKSKFYWFVLSGVGDNTGSASWQFTESTTHSGPGTLPNFAFFDSISQTWTETPDAPFLTEVNGSAVPEPGSLILGCVGISSVILAARRRRRAA